MSYFVVISGENAASVGATEGHLVPISEAQSYVANLAPKIAAIDGSPSFFWDDNETGTSHELVCAAERGLFEEHPLEASALGHLLKSCESHNVAARIWWADNRPDAFLQVPKISSTAEALALLQ